MTTYYVRKTGDDSNTGLSAALAWLTIDKAASTMQAGDTVYIGAGTYYEMVTIDYSGSSGSPIKYIADIGGRYTGDAGLVFISAIDRYPFSVMRDYSLYLIDKDNVEFYDIGFYGGNTATVYLTTASGCGYSNVIFDGCSFTFSSAVTNSYCFDMNYGVAVAPTGNGIRIKNCSVIGGLIMRFSENASAHVNVDFLADHSIFRSSGDTANLVYIDKVTSSSYTAYGFIFDYCTLIGGKVLTSEISRSVDGNEFSVYNSYIEPSDNLGWGANSSAPIRIYDSIILQDKTKFYTNTYNCITGFAGYTAGLLDLPLYRHFGYSPYRPGELVPVIDYFPSSRDNLLNDIYNRKHTNLFTIYSSFISASDPDNRWVNENQLIDSSTTNYGYTSIAGDSSSNYVLITQESLSIAYSKASKVTLYVKASGNAGGSIGIAVYDSGQTSLLDTFTIESLPTSSTEYRFDLTGSSFSLSDFSGLEIKIWKIDGTNILVYDCIMEYTLFHNFVGAVSSCGVIEKNTTVKYSGGSSICILATSYQELFIPVEAEETTVTVFARYDTGYDTTNSTLPTLTAFNIPGDTDKTDTMTSAADTWEQLSVTFTPTSTGYVRIRLSGNDVSGFGKTYFDAVERS